MGGYVDIFIGHRWGSDTRPISGHRKTGQMLTSSLVQGELFFASLYPYVSDCYRYCVICLYVRSVWYLNLEIVNSLIWVSHAYKNYFVNYERITSVEPRPPSCPISRKIPRIRQSESYNHDQQNRDFSISLVTNSNIY